MVRAKTDRRLAANDTYTQMHYDYIIEDLHMALATQAARLFAGFVVVIP